VNKKSILAVMFVLFLFFPTIHGIFLIKFVSANFLPAPIPAHTVEINANGEITGTDKIQRSGNIYTFIGDVVGSIVILCNGIVVDGAGYTLLGNGNRTGIWFQAITGVTIKNLHIRNFTYGVEFTYGMSTEGCSAITLSGNTITDNEHGITVWLFSSNNQFLDNIIANNTYGITLNHSPNNFFRNNQLVNNKYNFRVSSETGVQMTYFINDIDNSNTVDGKPIIYWVNEQDKNVPSGTGFVVLINCKNITVQNLSLTNNSQGILLVATNNSLIEKNFIANNNFGIVLFAPYEQCVGNSIIGNNITSNSNDGINSWNSEKTVVSENRITNNQEIGINFYDSRGAVISENTIAGNKEDQIKFWGGDSSDNTALDNQIENNQDNTIPENNLTLFGFLFLGIIFLTMKLDYSRKEKNEKQ
jgi:parallel beta-helix repeat protein